MIETLAAIRCEEITKEETGREENIDDLAQALNAFIKMDDDYQDRVRSQAEATTEVLQDIQQAKVARSNLLHRLKDKRRLSDNNENDGDDNIDDVEEIIPDGDGQPVNSQKELLKRNKIK